MAPVAARLTTLVDVCIAWGVPDPKEVPYPVMAAVEGPRVAREERAYAPGNRAIPGPDREVRVVW